jgi:hypothetical protein
MYQNVVETSHEGKVTIVWNQQVRTNKTIPNDKPDIIIRHNKKGTCMLIDVAIPGDRNVINKEDEKFLQPYNRNSAYVGSESRSDTGNTKGDWNHFKIIQTIPEQLTRKARN